MSAGTRPTTAATSSTSRAPGASVRDQEPAAAEDKNKDIEYTQSPLRPYCRNLPFNFRDAISVVHFRDECTGWRLLAHRYLNRLVADVTLLIKCLKSLHDARPNIPILRVGFMLPDIAPSTFEHQFVAIMDSLTSAGLLTHSQVTLLSRRTQLFGNFPKRHHGVQLLPLASLDTFDNIRVCIVLSSVEGTITIQEFFKTRSCPRVLFISGVQGISRKRFAKLFNTELAFFPHFSWEPEPGDLQFDQSACHEEKKAVVTPSDLDKEMMEVLVKYAKAFDIPQEVTAPALAEIIVTNST
ncbi:uncharacterized protein BJ171DRAFT_576714 [Polychytrium aggregatum]|uniref:uncharacterized protein n=1 Tax=Polychytrium aggregatum TaxID=110093 RepID=UPI0022FEA74D|nr:uncharacterized protein BJ171DRAFT_576714 [Polychytrium aggregatum]KAI9209907.1 hypothetical protein BJ171DRAFT_576714 [Polychytrium aggregatum]